MLLSLTPKQWTVLAVLAILIIGAIPSYIIGYRDGFANGEATEANKGADERVAERMSAYRKFFRIKANS